MDPYQTFDYRDQHLLEEQIVHGPPETTSLFSSNSTFMIIFPILIIFAVILVIGVFFLIWIIVQLVRNHYRAQAREDFDETSEDETTSSAVTDQIETISGELDLPTYWEVLRDVETGQAPPLYKNFNDAITTNSGAKKYHNDNQVTSDCITYAVTNEVSSHFKQISNDGGVKCLNANISDESDSTTGNDSTNPTPEQLSKSIENRSVLLQTSAIPPTDPAVNNSDSKSFTLSTANPVSIDLPNIDDVINSISVPSILSADNQELHSATIGNPERKEDSKRKTNKLFNQAVRYLSPKKVNTKTISPDFLGYVNNNMVLQRTAV